jgi:hypothetical protein
MSAMTEAGLDASGKAKVPVPPHVSADRVFEFDMYNPAGVGEIGLQHAWAKLLAPGVPDLVWTPYNGGHWIAVSGKLIRQAFEEYDRFSSECPFIPKEAGQEHNFIPASMDPPEQRPYRALISRVLGPDVIHALDGKIKRLAIELIEKLRPKGHCDFVKEFGEPFPIQVFMMLIDLPMEDTPRLKSLADQLTRPDGTMTFAQARDHLFDYLGPVIDRRMANPGTDAISKIIQGKVNGRPVTRDEMLRIGVMLLLAALDTVLNFLSFVMEFLAQSPQHRKELIDHPERFKAATEEFLRRFSLVADGRLIRHDTVFDGVVLKAGEMILLPQLLPGLDERENKCPMQVDFGREKIVHTTFGHGPHLCAGAHLARLETEVALREWLARIPEFSLAPGARVVHQGGVVGTVKSLPLVRDPATTLA